MHIRLLRTDDWGAVYKNGVVGNQNHSVDWPWFVRSLVGETIESFAMGWIEEFPAEWAGYAPDTWQEVLDAGVEEENYRAIGTETSED